MRKTGWHEFNGGTERIRAEYGWHTIGNQEPYWSVTVEVQEKPRFRWVESSGGTQHDLVRQHIPWLAPTLKYHLCSEKSGPLHYVSNALYWLAHGIGLYKRKSYDPDPTAAFKSTIVFGAVEGDRLPELAGQLNLAREVELWLLARLPGLIENMHREIDEVLATQSKG